jgi:hypothetical protein
MKRTQKIFQKLLEYTEDIDTPFTLSEAVEEIKDVVGLSPDELLDPVSEALDHNPWVFYDLASKLYLPRRHFFESANFLISLTPLERQEGYLIVGHRCVPFVARDLLPFQYDFFDYDDNMLEWREIEIPFSELEIYYSLYGYPRMLEMLMMEDEQNSELIMALTANTIPDVTVKIQVLDISSLLADLGEYDRLSVNVLDWREGAFQFDKKGRPQPSAEDVTIWRDLLEEGLIVAFDRLGPLTDVYEQLSQALFYGHPDVYHRPALHIGGFLSHMEQVSFSSLNGVPIFWLANQLPEDHLFERMWPERTMSGAHDTLEEIMYDIGSPLGESELEAYMRDELFRGGKDFNAVMRRFLPGPWEETFADDRQQEAFVNLAQGIWDNVSSTYNRFSDRQPGKCRTRCLDLLDELFDWMMGLERDNVDPESLPRKEFIAVTSMLSMLTQTITALNMDANEIPSEGLQTLNNTLNTLTTQVRQLVSTINAGTQPKKRPVFRVIQGGLSQKEKKS